MLIQKNLTVQDALRGLQLTLLAADRRPEYMRNVRRHADRVTFEQPLEDFDPYVVRQWARELTGAPSYRAQTMTVLLMAVKRMASPVAYQAWQQALANLRPTAEACEPTALTPDEAVRLLNRTRWTPYLHFAVLAALRAGLRHAEILHLRKDDFQGGFVLVRAKPEVGWTPKTHSERRVPVAADLQEAYTLAAERAGASPWLLPAPGELLPMTSLQRPVASAFRELGIGEERRPGLHMLRRTWATRLLGLGCPLHEVMRMAGWTKLSTAQKYLAPDVALQASYIDRL